MQIFRASKSHKISARYLCDRRLNKQILETYQIIRVCLAEMNIIEGNTRYLSHPIVAHVYNNGNPYLIDLYNYLVACDREFKRRGGNRGDKFANDLYNLKCIIIENKDKFSTDRLPPLFIFGDKVSNDDAKVYAMYRKLLKNKWKEDYAKGTCAKANVKYLRR